MTIRELIELLEQYDDDREVRLATQPNYPLEYTVGGVVGTEEIADDPDEDIVDADDDGPVWVVEGSQLGYASKALWDGCH